MAIYPRGNGYQLKRMIRGQLIRGQFATWEAAREFEMKCEAAIELGRPLPQIEVAGSKAAKVLTLQELLEHTYKHRWASQKAGAASCKLAQCFVDYVGRNVPVAEALNTENAYAYVEDRGISGKTANRHLSKINVLAEMARKLKLIEGSLELTWQKEGKGRVRFYSQAEEEMILQTCRQWGQMDFADLFVFLCDVGCRLGDAKRIQWVDIRGASVSLVETKNDESRAVTATPRVVEALARLRAQYGHTRGPFSWLSDRKLRTLWSQLRAYHEWMGADTVVHTYRHTCCSRLVIRGVDLLRVKMWMGHKRIETTMRYAQLAPKHLNELADVLAGYREAA